MSKIIVKSHVGEVNAALAYKIPVILEALGIEAEGNAVSEITRLGAVDTGRLRGSITHAHDNKNAAYVGTNVEYAPYVELGTYKMASRPFLRNAITKYINDYKEIVKKGLQS